VGWSVSGDDDRQARSPGFYAKLLDTAQAAHDRPDSRQILVSIPSGADGNCRDATPEEWAALVDQAKASPPGPLLAALLAGEPVVVRAGSSRLRALPWWDDFDHPYAVRVYPDDRVEPADRSEITPSR
jgi:hypothetical protein